MALESKAETASAKAKPATESVAAFTPSRSLVMNTQLLQQAEPAAWVLQPTPGPRHPALTGHPSLGDLVLGTSTIDSLSWILSLPPRPQSTLPTALPAPSKL